MMKKLLNLSAPTATSNWSGAKKILAALVMFCTAFSMQAQVSTYSYTSASLGGAYTNLVAPTVVIPAGWDNEQVIVGFGSPGFTFNFNGRNYTGGVALSANGFVTLENTSTALNFTPIASAEPYKNAISIFGYDLKGVGAVTISSETAGIAPNRTFTIQWIAYRDGVETPMNMQMVLNESAVGNPKSGVIEFKYKQTSGFTFFNKDGQIGLRGETNNDFYALSSTGNWAVGGLARGTTNTAKVRTSSSANVPASGIIMTWTPPTCNAPNTVTATAASITSNSATINWTAPSPAPANGYEYLVSTTAPNNINITNPAFGAAATGSVTAGTTVNLTGLTGSVTYYVYVRSDCGGTKSGWSVPATFTTKCPGVPVTYSSFFTPAQTVCDEVQTLGGPVWQNVYGQAANTFGFTGDFAQIVSLPNNGTNANSTYFIRGINIVAGQRYRVSYKYGTSLVFTSPSHNLQLRYGNAPVVSAMTTTLATHTNFRGGPYYQVVNFVAPTTGVYYFGFTDTTLAGNETTYLDDFKIEPSTCIEPNSLVAGGVTNTTASVSWTPGSPNNASSGYNYYVSTSPTPPTATTVPTNSTGQNVILTTLTSLSPGTTYYVWVQSNCGSGDTSLWSNPVSFTTTNAPVLAYCIPVADNTMSYITNVRSTGALANIDNTSTFPATAPYGYQNFTNREIVQARAGSLTVNISIAGPTVGAAIWVDWNQNGVFEASERVFNTTTYLTTIPPATFTVPVTAALGTTVMRVIMDYWSTNPNNPCVITNNSGRRGEAEDYSFTVKTQPTPILLSAASTTTCSGNATTPPVMILNPTAYNVYSWTPAGAVGSVAAGYTFAPSSSVVYTLTGLNTTTFETTTTTFTVNVNQPPTAITITPAAPATLCEGAPPVQLTAAGGITSGALIYGEDFNGFGNSFTTASASTGGNVAASVWTLRTDNSNVWGQTFNSNDNSQFYLTNSDAQGSGNTTDVTLTSAVFDLQGYTTASLSFWHYYRKWTSGDQYARVEVSRNGGAWTIERNYVPSGTQGAANNFVNDIIDLTPYIGTGVANVQVRFSYRAVWGWGWAIDNFQVTGSAMSSITWAPLPGLFTDSAGTIPYTGGGASSVYASPLITTSYTASATSGLGCVASQGVTVTVTPANAGTISPVSQGPYCTGLATVPLTFTTPPTSGGGSSFLWEYSDVPAFTSPTTVPGSANATTISPALIGQLTGDRYYRVKFTSGGTCGIKYSNIINVLVPSTTWNGIAWSNGVPTASTMAVVAGNLTLAANLTSCAVVQTSGNLVVNSGVTMLVQNQIVVNGGTMTFSNSANLVQVNSTIANSGNIDYKRTTPGIRVLDYTYWSSPVAPQTLSGVSPLTLSDKYFFFNPASAAGWVNVPAPATTLMVPAKGYIMRGPQTYSWTVPAPYTATFSGVPNNGDITIPITVATYTTNLIGNPYPSAISANAFISANSAAITGALYFWTHNSLPAPYQYSGTDYATYNFTGPLAGTPSSNPGVSQGVTPNGFIGAGQGFIVKGLAPGTVNATFTNSMRGVGVSNSQFFRVGHENETEPMADIEKHRIWLDVTNAAGNYRQTLIGYVEGATDAIDFGFDAEVLAGGNPVELYSKVSDKKLAIKGVGLPFSVADQHELVFKTTVAGEYQLAASQFDEMFGGYNIFVEDRLLNMTHNLKESAYSFTTEPGTFENRFLIKFAENSLSTIAPDFTQNNVVVYKKDQKIYINTGSITMDNVQLFDMRGAQILEQTSVNSNEAVLSPNVAQQVLIVKIKSVDGVEVSKKIVF